MSKPAIKKVCYDCGKTLLDYYFSLFLFTPKEISYDLRRTEEKEADDYLCEDCYLKGAWS